MNVGSTSICRQADCPVPAGRAGLVPTARVAQVERATEQADVTRLPEFLRAGDLLVVNDTKVFRAAAGEPRTARRPGRRSIRGGAVECISLKLDDDHWDALVHPGPETQPGARMIFQRTILAIHAEVLDRHFHGRHDSTLDRRHRDRRRRDRVRRMRAATAAIKREDRGGSRSGAQTVYANERGSVNGADCRYHFTPGILKALEARGVSAPRLRCMGYGTFQPVRATQVKRTFCLESFSSAGGCRDDQSGEEVRPPHRVGRDTTPSTRDGSTGGAR